MREREREGGTTNHALGGGGGRAAPTSVTWRRSLDANGEAGEGGVGGVGGVGGAQALLLWWRRLPRLALVRRRLLQCPLRRHRQQRQRRLLLRLRMWELTQLRMMALVARVMMR